MVEIIEREISRQEFQSLLSSERGPVVIKFGADWCGPCKQSREFTHFMMEQLPNGIICLDIDVDESFDLYAWMKSKKQVNGIPAILAYNSGNAGPGADASVSGSNQDEIKYFFDEVNKMVV